MFHFEFSPDLEVSVSFDLEKAVPLTSSLVSYQTFMSWYHRSEEDFGGEINKHKQRRRKCL